ncbi:MAG: L-arabinose isomerase [Anaerolineales bacterium]|nr:L-arabinose isomerase [Anaerolineales bacterium]
MIDLKKFEVWFVTGSQNLYGPEFLGPIGDHSKIIAEALDKKLGVKVVYKPVMTTSEAIRDLCLAANSDPNCVGLITWMHTFSPAQKWISGLSLLKKPYAHLHTQFNDEIPWADIDMAFMNLNQSAHGDREYGFICSRLEMNRKVVVGHWQDEGVQVQLDSWARVAAAWADWQSLKIARFGDNMREVAVTEGDKVEAHIRFGYAVFGYGVGDLVAHVQTVSDAEAEALIKVYEKEYILAPELKEGGSMRESLVEAARIEAGLRSFLKEGGFKAFTTTFEDLHGLKQLPGLAVQRLMADGYGFGAEGDWKTSALVRAMKVMAAGKEGGTSFMEDYTYHFSPEGDKVLGAHMLEVCPSITDGDVRLEIHQLSIGGKEDPARLVFDTRTGDALNATIVQMGNRFRMIVNEVEVVPTDKPMPKLPVARALWMPKPNLKVAAAAWIYAGGAHHTGFSHIVTKEQLQDFAEMADMEYLLIDNNTNLDEFKKELKWNELYYKLK